LRDLLNDSGLREIFQAVEEKRRANPKPLLVKVSPDMTDEELMSVVGLVKEFELNGIVATNTTIMPERGQGGISGKLLYERSRRVRHFLLDQLRETPQIELIGVGGFQDFSQLKDFWKHGGRLVQIYSAFIFQGPALLYRWERALAHEYMRVGAESFEQYRQTL